MELPAIIVTALIIGVIFLGILLMVYEIKRKKKFYKKLEEKDKSIESARAILLQAKAFRMAREELKEA